MPNAFKFELAKPQQGAFRMKLFGNCLALTVLVNILLFAFCGSAKAEESCYSTTAGTRTTAQIAQLAASKTCLYLTDQGTYVLYSESYPAYIGVYDTNTGYLNVIVISSETVLDDSGANSNVYDNFTALLRQYGLI